MTSRAGSSLLLFWCVLVSGAGAVKGEDQSPDAPMYAERPLSAWVDEVAALGRRVVNTNRAEVRALRAIGTNAIPWLLGEMKKLAPPEGLDAHTNIHQPRAIAGFWALSETGAAAIPSLV